MEHLFHVPQHDLLLPKLSSSDKLARAVPIYLVLLIIFRAAPKLEMAQATLFDFLIVPLRARA